ncbi:MAG TPA: hypothetical protein V6D23_22955, partial [Candidatus Obscuribacterales bacterium]
LDKVLLVPTQALIKQESQANQLNPVNPANPVNQTNQVFCQVLEAGQARLRPVVTGPSDARMTVIRSGLKAGEQVILDPVVPPAGAMGTSPAASP